MQKERQLEGRTSVGLRALSKCCLLLGDRSDTDEVGHPGTLSGEGEE